MKQIEIKIVDDVLKSAMALHDFGKPVKKYIENKISSLQEQTLFVISLLGANPIDYEFVNIAFSDIIGKYQSDPKLYIIFKAGKWEKEELLTGLIDILKLKNEAKKTEESILIEHKFSILIVDDKNAPYYLSYLSEEHIKVLKEVEQYNGLTSSHIQSVFSLNAEDTSQILNDLLRCKFIYSTEGPCYHSIKSLISST